MHPEPAGVSSRLAVLLALALGIGPTAAAQEAGAHHHGLGQLGRVTFPVSCTPEAQRRFERAMAVLHSFWWDEGERAFGAVLEADSSCSMAHWGRALNAWGNPFAGGPSGAALAHAAAAATRAASRPLATPREQGFVNAVAALYRDAAATSNATRLQAYADTMARLYRDLPTDTEVVVYYALALLATAPRTDTTFAQQRRAVALLDPLYARHPDHPGLAHYIIHSTDSPRLASDGLKAARRYARIAPSAPHAQHMPSHIFVRLGLWGETVASNRRAFEAGMAHARATESQGVTSHELHTLDYAVYGYLQRGQDSAAGEAVATGQALMIPPAQISLITEYNRTAMAARISLERGDWTSAASFPAPAAPEKGVAAMLSRFTRAVGSARSRQPRAAQVDVDALGAIARDLETQQEAYWSRIAGIKRDAASAWIRFESGDTAGGLAARRRGGGHRGRHRQAPRHAGRAAAGPGAPGRHAACSRASRRGAGGVSRDARPRARPGPESLRSRPGGRAGRRPARRERELRRVCQGDGAKRRSPARARDRARLPSATLRCRRTPELPPPFAVRVRVTPRHWPGCATSSGPGSPRLPKRNPRFSSAAPHG